MPANAVRAVVLRPEIYRQRREAAAEILRHPETWPADFVWQFGSHFDCAMALINEIMSLGETMMISKEMGQFLGMDAATATSIFIHGGLPVDDDTDSIMASDIANLILAAPMLTNEKAGPPKKLTRYRRPKKNELVGKEQYLPYLPASMIQILEATGSYNEIKAALGIREIGTVKSRLNRARLALSSLEETLTLDKAVQLEKENA